MNALVLTVNKRLARSLREAHTQNQIARGVEAWETPDILPWDAWLVRTWLRSPDAAGRILLGATQEQYVWEHVIAGSEDAGRLLDIAPAAHAAMEAWSLAQQWDLEMRGEEWERCDDTNAFLGWARAFSARCDSEGWLDRARLAARVAELVRAGCIAAPEQIALQGFDELSPRQRALLDALKNAGCRVEIGETATNERGEAKLVALRDENEEIAAAARWARALLESGAKGPIGIVIPGLDALRTRVERVFADTLHPGRPDASPRAFNISAAPALADQPLVHTALLVLRLGRGRLSLSEAGSLLRSPFLHGSGDEFTARARIDAEIRKTGEIEVTAAALERQCGSCPHLAQSIESWRTEWRELPREQSPSGWCRSFSKLLRAFGWPRGRALNSAEHQALEAWQRALSELAALDTCAGSMESSQAMSRLARIARETAFQPGTETPAPVQILGVLEASGQRFEHLWLMGIDDEAWPAPARPNPFLPLRLQRECGLPHATPERELDFARTITGRLLSSAADIVVSFPQREDDRDLRPSPLVAQLPPGSAAATAAEMMLDRVRAARGMETKVEPPPAPLDASVEVRGGTRIFQLQAACPFWAFGEFRLGAKALEEGEFGLRALDRGTLIHRTLERVWREIQTHERLCAMSGDAIDALVRESIEAVLEDYRPRRPQALTPRFTELERSRIVRLVRQWLEGEKQRAPFEMVQLEDARTVEIGGLRIRARLDRIDRLADGRHVILDYKTGEVELNKWDGARPDEPQLPVYSVTDEDGIAGVFFAQIKTGKVQFKGIAQDANMAPGAKPLSDAEWQARMDEWRAVLEKLAQDFREGRAGPDPKRPGETCLRCGLTSLCRARELGQYCLPQDEDGE